MNPTLGAHELRRRFFLEQNEDLSTKYELLGASSVGNFDNLIGAVSLGSLIPLLKAQILSVSGKEREALDIYEIYLLPVVGKEMRRHQADLLADMAWCRLKVGQEERARRDAAVAVLAIDPSGHFDDQAFAHGRLAQIFNVLGDSESCNFHRQLGLDAWAGHSILQRRIFENLERELGTSHNISE